MKELKLETRVEVYAVGELDNIYRQLYEAAFQASKKAYAPYSKFHVGAAVLLENGEILSGCGSSDFGDRGYEGWGTCGSYHALWCLPASDVGNRATL